MQITNNQNIPFRAIIEFQQQWKYNCKTKIIFRVHDFSNSLFKHPQYVYALSNILLKYFFRKFCECVKRTHKSMSSGHVMFMTSFKEIVLISKFLNI